MRVAIAQLNPVVGDIDGNLKKIVDTLNQTRSDAPDLVVFSELFLVGYPPRDLLERPMFIEKVQNALHELLMISREFPETGILLGVPMPTGSETGRGLYNSAVLIYRGSLLAGRHKSLLPNYDVFDEARYFDPTPEIDTIAFKNEVLGVSICEDAWNDQEVWPRRNYACDPVDNLVKKGATILINISASPFTVGKEEVRYRIISNYAKKHGIPFLYVNQVGGNDELIFDGRSMCVDKTGSPIAVLPSFQEFVQTINISAPGTPGLFVPQEKVESVYEALVLGIRDYIKKCGFSKVVIGLSGGIDSAVVCCLATAALGKENVLGVTMPSPYSSKGSIEDSRQLAQNLGVQFKEIPITGIFSSYGESLKEHFEGREPDITEENIQARIRGSIVMSISNKFGYLVLSTGNKSEMAVGYCTLYGDMCGGLSVISDVPKTMVYELAQYINREGELIPQATITKPPSAELRPDQLDQDSLPPYDVLDKILYYYLDEGYSEKDIVNKNFDPGIVEWVTRNVDRNEYKRRQAAPGLKVTSKAFGVGRRMPIAAKYKL